MKKYLIFALIVIMHSVAGFAQNAGWEGPKDVFRPIITGVPSLTIAPDARGGAMGDIGVASSPDINSQYWNPAKYAFMLDRAGFSLSYTPWLRKLVNDINLAYLTAYWKLGSDNQHALSASLRYFSLGEVYVTPEGGNQDASFTISPYEMALDAGYSIRLSEALSGGVVLRYIHSDMSYSENDEVTPGWAVAADMAAFYNKYFIVGNNECLFSLGLNISNIGSKISYDGGTTSSFLPTNMRLGTSVLIPVSDYNTFAFNLDLNKLLVPTPPGYFNMTDEEKEEARLRYQDMSPITGIFKSFSDAPLKEELEEIMWSLGAEYSYKEQFFLRGGYFHESQNKGNRKYFALGAGFKMNVFQLDAAYLISTAQTNPLDQTLRFSLSFNMDGIKDILGR
jgi:hypothetical protein